MGNKSTVSTHYQFPNEQERWCAVRSEWWTADGLVSRKVPASQLGAQKWRWLRWLQGQRQDESARWVKNKLSEREGNTKAVKLRSGSSYVIRACHKTLLRKSCQLQCLRNSLVLEKSWGWSHRPEIQQPKERTDVWDTHTRIRGKKKQ